MVGLFLIALGCLKQVDFKFTSMAGVHDLF